MNEIKMEERGQIEKFCEIIANELFEIKMHICNERYFEGGVGLGGLLSSVINRQMQEAHERSKNEEVQDQEIDQECEEGSEEEGSSEECYFLRYTEEKDMRKLAEEKNEKLHEQIDKMEKTVGSINETKRCIFELQDLLMRLIKFRKINLEEVENVINILKNTGVDKSDINVICKGLVK